MPSELLRTDQVTIGGVPTRAVRADGDPDRVRFLFLHGFSDSADCWQRVQKRLAAAGHGSLAVDQPSHGHADPLHPDLPVIEQFLAFAAAAARATDDGRPVVVVGNSLGGAHALLLGQHHPELVHGVAAISPAAFDHPGWFRILDSRFNVSPEGVVPTVVRRALAGPAMRAVGFGMPHRVPAGFVRTWAQSWHDPTRRRALHDLATRVPAEYFHADPVDLCAVDVPVLALWGTRDRLTLISSRQRFEQDCTDLEFVALPGVGHMAQVEVPGRTTKHLLSFAARLTDGATPAGATEATLVASA
ncbi:MAG TPA: alpha/beta fold hydrolase [Acidimicrobiales bacterium]|nr:alpha/beta fold hydrolase [Acidimicrobiales bacterium]